MDGVKFDLHPWELKWSHVESEGEADFELQTGGEMCQFRRVQTQSSSCPYFRFLGAPEEHFLLANFNSPDPRLKWEPLSYSNDKFPVVIEHEVQRAFELHTWGRYFWLRPDFNCIQKISELSESVWNIFLLANGQATLVGFRSADSGSKGMSWNSVVPFQWHQGPSPEILRARTNSEWIDWLQREIGNTESNVHFAHHFAGLSGEEARLHFTVWQHGNLQEWNGVLRWILQSEIGLQKDASHSKKVHWTWSLVETEHLEQAQRGYINRFDENGQRFTSEISDVLTSQRLLIASRYFAPSLDIESLERRLSIKYHPRPLYLGVSASIPTAHERLEAALNLRDWAQGKFSPEEIAILCGFE